LPILFWHSELSHGWPCRRHKRRRNRLKNATKQPRLRHSFVKSLETQKKTRYGKRTSADSVLSKSGPVKKTKKRTWAKENPCEKSFLAAAFSHYPPSGLRRQPASPKKCSATTNSERDWGGGSLSFHGRVRGDPEVKANTSNPHHGQQHHQTRGTKNKKTITAILVNQGVTTTHQQTLVGPRV